jgi:hypothetical protein
MRLKRSALCLVLIALVVLTVSSTYACTIDEVKQDPEIPNEGEPVNVTATVTSEENKEHTAILSYSTDEGETWTNVTMSETSKNTFVGQIPPLPAGIKIRYKIIASDDEGYVAIYDNDDSLNISTYLPWILGAIAAAITVLIGVAYYRKKKK